MYLKLTSIEVENSNQTIKPNRLDGCKPGEFVSVRPCGERYEGKTFLGMYLCSAPTGFLSRQEGEKIIIHMNEYTNPAIYVPELDEIIWGYGSWWGKIKSEDDLRQITDEDIENVWYVKALKQMEEQSNQTVE